MRRYAFLLFLASIAYCAPQYLTDIYDIDCNGIPDLCYIEGTNVNCLEKDNTWTSFPATSIVQCNTATASRRSSIHISSSSTTSVAPSSSNSDSASSPNSSASSDGLASSYGTLPKTAQFAKDKGSKWKIELQGNIQFAGLLENKNLRGDKCRTGRIGEKIIWNCSDMQCDDAWQVCGFSMGPAFYGTDTVMEIDTSNVSLVQNNEFISAWHGDIQPVQPQSVWGMDTSNIAPINDTHGVAFAWQTWRGTADGAHVDRGNAVAAITLGPDRPIAERMGPLLTGPEKIQLGLLAILRADRYIYTYSIGGPSNVIIGRVPADDSVFDTSKHEFLFHGSDIWIKGIPSKNDQSFGAVTANSNGKFGCSVYGSIFYNTYLRKYIMLCDIFMLYVNMYLSDTPYGPWSEEYQITSVGKDGLMPNSYGSMAHPEYGDGREWYFSIGPNTVFQVFKVSFQY